ncbi:MAG TPA: AAA family ATPase [Chitinophagaceae bacterium]|nr:AAA family ATPase [Chitinophagaceae bacterium]
MKTNTKTPIVIIVFGLPGTGKTYFASKLAEQINAEYINSDRLRKELFPKRTYSDKEKEIVYKEMLEKTKRSIDENRDVVLDATFYKNDVRKMLIKEIKNKSEIFFIEIVADENMVRRRLQMERPHSEADFNVYKLIQRQWEPLNEPHLVLNSTGDNIYHMLQKTMDHLQKKNDKGSDQ